MTQIVKIDRMSYGSAAIGSLLSGKTIFVEGAVPGDTVLVEVTEEKPTYARGRVEDIVEPSPNRVQPPLCAQTCGGCPWSDMNYEAQLNAKRASVVDALRRVAHFDPERAEELVNPIRGSKHQWGYRNKLELAATTNNAGKLELGYFKEGTHDVVPISACKLGNRMIEKAPKALTGALRYLSGNDDLGIFRVGVRGSVRTKDVEIALWTKPSGFPRAAAVKTLQSALKCNSIVRVMAEPGSARKVKKVEVLSGKGCWAESLTNGIEFFTSAPSFFQVNTAQAEVLVELALAGLQVEEGSYIADLYAGGGTFSIPLALAGADVVAVESAGSSVRDLRRNAERNQVDIEVVGGDAARELPELGELDGLVVDPPRAGLANGVVESIAQANPERVVYVSCDPQTWARDVARFESAGYVLAEATPVDMFPQTFHIETVSLFTRL